MTLGLVLYFNPLFALALLPIYLTVSILLPLFAMKAGRSIGMRCRTKRGEVKSLVLESAYRIKDIQIFGYGPERMRQVREQNRRVKRAAHGLTLHKQSVPSAPIVYPASYPDPFCGRACCRRAMKRKWGR